MEDQEYDLNIALANWHDYRVDQRTFIVYVGGDPSANGPNEPGVEYRMADRFDLNLEYLSSIDSERPILIHMSSCGGDCDEGMQMFGAILACPNPVTVLAIKTARSMTSIIPLAADRFVIRPPAQYMFHHGTYDFTGLDQEAEAADVERRKSNELMYRIYITRLKEQGRFKELSEESIRQTLRHEVQRNIDVWLSAYDAKRWGFVDSVYEGNYNTLRASGVNRARRENLLSVLRQPIHVEVKVS